MIKIDPNQPLQATAAALFHSTAVRDLMLRGFVVAQSPAAVPELFVSERRPC